MKAVNIIFSLLIILSFTSCKKAQEAPKEVSFPIKMAKAGIRDVPVILNSFGTLSPPNTIDIKAQASGEIVNVPFKEGAFVNKGDLLISIDPSPYLANLQQNRAGVLQAQAQATYAKESYESYKQLREQDFISVIDLANYLQNSQVADASVLSNIATLQNSKINLGYTQITAPISGFIGFMGYQKGNIANINDTLVTLVQVQPLYLLFSLSEQDLWSLRESLKTGPVAISGSFLNKERLPIEGSLFALDNSVDIKTGTISIKASFPNESLEAWPGEFIKIKLFVKTLPSVVVIDKAALQYGQKGPFIYVVNKTMHVTTRNVTVGPTIGESVAILEGLKADEDVVIEGHFNLYPEAKVYLAI